MGRLQELLDRAPPGEDDGPDAPAQNWVAKAISGVLEEMVTKAELENKMTPGARSEIGRICAIPISEPLTDEEVHAVNLRHVKADQYDDGFRLNRDQAEALQTFEEMGTVFAPVPVGGGKTLIALRVAGIAYSRGVRRIMLTIPVQVNSQLQNRDVAWIRARVPLDVPFAWLGGRGRVDRELVARSTQRGVLVVPYSLLSTEDTARLLELFKPELLICDEAHKLKNKRAACTRRIMKFLRESPNTKLVCLSGTMSAKSVKDYAHLLESCLDHGSPLPRDAQVVADWAAVLDASDDGWNEITQKHSGTGPLRPLVKWSNDNFPHDKLGYNTEGFRRAFQNRLLTTPGVVASAGTALGTSLIIENDRVVIEGDGAAELKELDRRVEKDWIKPNGDEIEWAMHKFAARQELSAGIYNDLRWPEAKDAAEEDALERAKEHHVAQQEYHRKLREWLKYHSHDGVDTPMLVGSEMSRHGPRLVGEGLYDCWREMKDLEFEGMPERESIPVRVCDFKVRAAVEWMKRNDRGFVWYWHQAVGDWIAEMAKAEGLPAVHCPAGKQHDRYLTAPDAAEVTRDKFLICSINAHGEGKNLQYMSRQFVVQFPRPEKAAEQMIGRTHRQGQEADEVVVSTCISTEQDEISLAATLNDAVFVYETQSSPRKVLIATWDPMPIVYGEHVLKRAGSEAKKLNIRQRKILQDRFGDIREAV